VAPLVSSRGEASGELTIDAEGGEVYQIEGEMAEGQAGSGTAR
jgi:hypothetical protein